jgi:hypothetical protein
MLSKLNKHGANRQLTCFGGSSSELSSEDSWGFLGPFPLTKGGAFLGFFSSSLESSELEECKLLNYI